MQFLNTNRTNGLELLIKTPCSTSFGQGDRLDEFLDELALQEQDEEHQEEEGAEEGVAERWLVGGVWREGWSGGLLGGPSQFGIDEDYWTR